jgi:hypothetical protein
MDAITAGRPLGEPPEWAVLERSLLDSGTEAVEVVQDVYCEDDGRILWENGGIDDAYEGFSNWPLLYLAGADESVREAAIDQWETITEQFDEDSPARSNTPLVDEFPASHDWMHHGEGLQFFYGICLAAPDHDRFRERARRFADLYRGDSEAGNYDPDARQLRGAHNGTAGPSVPSGGDWAYWPWKERYGLPFTDVEGIDTLDDLKDDDEAAARMGEVVAERWQGETAANLGVTSLLTNAYLLTGDEEYRDWVVDYVDAWEERTDRNDGILPDNVGPSGEIGEYAGRWYGGYYGWTWPHGWRTMGDGATAAAENATLLDRDPEHLDFVRSTMDALADEAIETDDTLFVPYRKGDPAPRDFTPNRSRYVLEAADGTVYERDGWFAFQPMDPRYPVHLWAASGRSADRERIERFADHARGTPDRIMPGHKNAGGNEAAWAAYLDGTFPDYPERILGHCASHAAERLALARDTPEDWRPDSDEFLNFRNPIDVEGLLHCTMGGPMPVYNGGLLQTRVRHFDPERERPGLPPDVAALVSSIDADSTTIELVNLGATAREVVVQAGCYGEHEFGEVTYTVDAADPKYHHHEVEAYGDLDEGGGYGATIVDDRALPVSLPGGTRTTLECETRRYVGEPSAAPPWDR